MKNASISCCFALENSINLCWSQLDFTLKANITFKRLFHFIHEERRTFFCIFFFSFLFIKTLSIEVEKCKNLQLLLHDDDDEFTVGVDDQHLFLVIFTATNKCIKTVDHCLRLETHCKLLTRVGLFCHWKDGKEKKSKVKKNYDNWELKRVKI